MDAREPHDPHDVIAVRAFLNANPDATDSHVIAKATGVSLARVLVARLEIARQDRRDE